MKRDDSATGIALTPLPPDIVVVAADCPLQYFLWGRGRRSRQLLLA